LLLATNAHAQETLRPAMAIDEMQVMSAAPDAPYAGIGWRWGMRARGGVAAPIVRDPEGWRVRFDGFAELYNTSLDAWFPYEFWRGYLAIRVGYRWPLSIDGIASAFALTFGIEHESDHETFHGRIEFPTYVYADAFATRGDLLFSWPELTLMIGVTARAHFADCTDVRRNCVDVARAISGSFETNLDISARTGGLPLDDGNVRGCAAIHMGYIVPVANVIQEARASLDVGACWRIRGMGEWQFLGEARGGSDLGMHRAQSIAHLGLSVRWVL
jgi:hypothetical protein